MNWIDVMLKGTESGVVVFDDRAATGEFTARLASLMKLMARRKPLRRLETFWVKPNTLMNVDMGCWGGHLATIVGGTLMGCKVMETPEYLTSLYLDSGFSLPPCTVGLAVGICDNGDVVLGAY